MKPLLLFSRIHGYMQNPTEAAMRPPRRMLMKRVNDAVRPHPADTELAEMFVPICAIMTEAEMNQTPNLVA